ncbi:hypothetical protein F5Y03DRAFT_408580 [Xylaria venustula]|nr:hypothetical protein F5Y03DRAFT_408580 [Xylaria venustula]
MDKLPAEVLQHIVSFIPRWTVGPVIRHSVLPALATVSRRFQSAIERCTFEHLRIIVTDEQIRALQQTMNPERILHLRGLTITLMDPARQAKATTTRRFETDQDRQAEREILTTPLRQLWNLLRTWDKNDSKSFYLELSATNSHPTPDEHFSSPMWTTRVYAFSMLDLAEDMENFPALPFITRFQLSSFSRYWNPRVAMVLASKMPNLEKLEWGLDEAEFGWGRYYSIDKQYRDNLVHSTKTMGLPQSLRSFACTLKRPGYNRQFDNEDHSLPRFIERGSPDPMSLAMRDLTRNCTDIRLSGSFLPALFHPLSSIPGAEEQPCWQHAKRLNIMIFPCSPDGSWLMRQRLQPTIEVDVPEHLLDCTQLPPGYADTEEGCQQAQTFYNDHLERVIRTTDEYYAPPLFPDDENMNAMMVAFARCCARMPALEYAIVDFDYYQPSGYQMICVAAHHRLPDFKVDKEGPLDRCRIYLHFNDWRPEDATINEFEQVGVKKDGKPSSIFFVNDKHHTMWY